MLSIYSQTNIGRRESNQDRFVSLRFAGIDPQRTKDVYLIIVADGMGGHSSGEKYAELVIRCISSRIAGIVAEADMQSILSGETFADVLSGILGREKETLLSKVNSDLVAEAYESKMELGGTTASVCIIYEDKAYFMNSGDSPIYRYNEYTKTAKEIGVRDNKAETQVREGILERGTDSYYFDSSQLLFFFGKRSGYSTPSEIESHFSTHRLAMGDVILMGSDGAFGGEILCEEQLAAFLSGAPGVRYYGKELLAKAARTTDDNQTLTVIRYIKEAEGGYGQADVTWEGNARAEDDGTRSAPAEKAAGGEPEDTWKKRWLNKRRKK